MALTTRNLTLGNKTRYTLDYSYWLDEGVSLASITVTSNDVTAIVSGAQVLPSGQAVFFVEGGTLNQPFTLAVQAVDSRTERKNDTIEFNVVAP